MAAASVCEGERRVVKRALDETAWLVTKTVQIVALLAALTYGMTGWMEW